MCFSIFSFFILPLGNAANNKHGTEKKEQKQIFIFYQGSDEVSQRAAALDLYIRCKEFILEGWFSILKYDFSLTIENKRAGLSMFSYGSPFPES